MSDDIQSTETAYTTKDLAEMLNIAVPTVRKYAQALEKYNYTFMRDKHQNRFYVQKDVIAMQYFKTFRESKSLSVDMAAKAVAAKINDTSIQNVSPANTTKTDQYNTQYTNEIDELRKEISEYKKIMARQNELLETTLSKLDKQQKYIDASFNQMDERVVGALRSYLETKEQQPQISAAKTSEETNDTNKEDPKKGFFQRLFRG